MQARYILAHTHTVTHAQMYKSVCEINTVMSVVPCSWKSTASAPQQSGLSAQQYTTVAVPGLTEEANQALSLGIAKNSRGTAKTTEARVREVVRIKLVPCQCARQFVVSELRFLDGGSGVSYTAVPDRSVKKSSITRLF